MATVKGTVQVSYKCFETPNFVLARFPSPQKDNDEDGKALPLSSIPDDTFEQLVREWVKEMYEKAKKQQPATPV